MARTTSPTSTFSLASLTFACSLALACGESADTTDTTDAGSTRASATTPAPTPESAPAPTPAPVEIAHALELASQAPAPDEQPLLASSLAATPTGLESLAGAESIDSSHAGSVPPGTPEAFASVRTKRDKPPVAGIGASGIHLDELEVGTGWAKSRCEGPTRSFAAGTDDRVNVCFRVVHPKLAEQVSVEWSFRGKVRTTTRVGVAASHAYLTRAWLPVAPSRAGEWTATIKSEDGSVLGSVAFEITK